MRRIQFIELHEQAWLPSFLRDEITDTLQFGLNLFNAYAPAVPLLRKALDSTLSGSVVDLCSGGGGPWLKLYGKLGGEAQPLHVTLTDKYPSASAFQGAGAVSEGPITYYPSAVDAMNVPSELRGFRTIFTSFHHFSVEEARAILKNAVDAREGIGVFEVTRRAPRRIALMLGWVLMLFIGTPWIRPFRWSRLFWTYVVPVVPLVLLFDGIVSCLRTYSLCELDEIVGVLAANDYQWEIGESTGKVPITYLIGCPRELAAKPS